MECAPNRERVGNVKTFIRWKSTPLDSLYLARQFRFVLEKGFERRDRSWNDHQVYKRALIGQYAMSGNYDLSSPNQKSRFIALLFDISLAHIIDHIGRPGM